MFTTTKFTLKQLNPHLSDEEFNEWMSELESQEFPSLELIAKNKSEKPKKFKLLSWTPEKWKQIFETAIKGDHNPFKNFKDLKFKNLYLIVQKIPR